MSSIFLQSGTAQAMPAITNPQKAKLRCGKQPSTVFCLPATNSMIQQYRTVPKPIEEKPHPHAPTRKSGYVGENAEQVPNTMFIVKRSNMALTRPNLHTCVHMKVMPVSVIS